MATITSLARIRCPFKAVAEYPPTLPYVGQDEAYHRLVDFTDSMRRETESHFLAAYGDWAIGKSRLAHELIAQFCGQSRGWLLSDGSGAGPLLQPLAEGGSVVPLFVSFVDALNFEQFGIDLGTAMGKLTCAAAAYLADQRRARSSHRALLDALRSELENLDPNFDFDRLASLATDTSRGYTERALSIVQAFEAMSGGRATRLLIIVDEVESSGEQNPFADEIEREINARPIPLRAVRDLYSAVKDATNTNAYPRLNFLFFNTLVSKRVANMEALERRMITADLEKASASDLELLMAALRASGYPLEGTLEDLARRAFFAADRNFGWFSFIMNKAHYILVQQPELGIGQVFAEVCQRTGRVFQPRVFEDRDIRPDALKDAMRRIIYNQIPATLADLGIPASLLKALLEYQDPFQTRFVGSASVVEVSADALTDNLLSTGLYVSERKPLLIGEGSANFDPAAVLASLRTFAWTHDGVISGAINRLWIYDDSADFEGQVGFAYPGFGANLSAATVRKIHELLLARHRVSEPAVLVAPTMALLRRFNDLWGKAAASNWLQEPTWEQIITAIDRTPDQNDQRLLRGIANVLFDAPQPQSSPAPYPDVLSPCLVLKLESHESLNVTPRNQLVILKARETAEGIANDLKAIRQRVPVLLVFARASDHDAFERYLHETHQQHLAVAVIPHVVEPQTREWEFYIRYSLRDQQGGFKTSDVNNKGRDLRNEFRDVLIDKFRQWLRGVEKDGYVVRPFFPARSANTPAFRDFARAYVALLRAGGIGVLGAEAPSVTKGLEDYEREAHDDTMRLVAGDGPSRRAVVPPIMPRILDLLRMQPRKLPELEADLFYARSSRAVSFPTNGSGVLDQLMMLMQEMGIVETNAQSQYVVRTVSMIGAKFELAFQRLGAFDGDKSGYARRVSSLSAPVRALASQLAVNEDQLALLKSQQLLSKQSQLSQLPLDHLTALPPEEAAFQRVAASIGQIASALDEVLGQSGQNPQPPAIDPRTLQANIDQISHDKDYHEFSIEYRVTFLQQLEEYLSSAEQRLLRVVAERRAELAARGESKGDARFPVQPMAALLAGVEADLNNELPDNKLPDQLRQRHNDVPLKVLIGAGRLADVLLKIAWYGEQLDPGNPEGWWVRYTTVAASWQAVREQYTGVAAEWEQLRRYFAGTPPEHMYQFTGPELERDVQELADAVADFASANDTAAVTTDDLSREMDAIREKCVSASERITAARVNADAEITEKLDQTDDAAVRHLAGRLHKEGILPDRRRVTDARTHHDAHTALDHYQQDVRTVGTSLCDGNDGLLDRYLAIYRDSQSGLGSEQLIQRYTEPVLQELAKRKLVTLRTVVDI